MTKYNLSVRNIAVSGTTAREWAENKTALVDAVRATPNCKYVWLTIGGNDAIPAMMDDEDINVFPEKIVNDTKVFLDLLFAEFPNIKVV